MPKRAAKGYVAKNKRDAFDHIACGLFYFLQHNTKTTVIILLLMFASSGYVIYDYVKSDKVRIEELNPVVEAKTLSLHTPAYAGEPQRGDSILIDGKFYGFSDPRYKIYKFYGFDALMIYDLYEEAGVKVEFKIDIPKRMMQLKK